MARLFVVLPAYLAGCPGARRSPFRSPIWSAVRTNRYQRNARHLSARIFEREAAPNKKLFPSAAVAASLESCRLFRR